MLNIFYKIKNNGCHTWLISSRGLSQNPEVPVFTTIWVGDYFKRSWVIVWSGHMTANVETAGEGCFQCFFQFIIQAFYLVQNTLSGIGYRSYMLLRREISLSREIMLYTFLFKRCFMLYLLTMCMCIQVWIYSSEWRCPKNLEKFVWFAGTGVDVVGRLQM